MKLPYDPIASLLGSWAAEITLPSILLRVALSFLFAAVVGWERANKRHAEELEAARSQMALEVRPPSEILSMVVTELDAAARIIRDRGAVPAGMTDIVDAAFRVALAAQDVSAPPPPAPNRQQRRASKKRTGGKKR